MHKSFDEMSADSRANSNDDKGDDESKDSLANLPSLQRANAMIFISGKQRKGEGVANAQIWKWKSHNERVPDTKQIEPGYNISVCLTTVPGKCYKSL
jgi:hypothetical protein